MHTIFTERFKRSTDLQLLKVLESKKDYDPKAVETAFAELQSRGVIAGFFAINDFSQEDIRKIKERIYLEHNKNVKSHRTKLPEHRFTAESWKWMPWKYVWDISGYYALWFIIVVALSFPVFHFPEIIKAFYLLIIAIPLWQTNIISNREYKRAFHFHNRILFACHIVILVIIANNWVGDYSAFGNDSESLIITLFFKTLIVTGSISFFVYRIKNKSEDVRWYFLHRTRWAIPVAIVVLLVLMTLREGWFKTNNIIQWKENEPLTYEDFSGYANYFTDYDGEIYSDIYYRIDEQGVVQKLSADFHSSKSWINPWDKGDSYLLLQHEQYHFNITEWVSRQTRKMIYDTLQRGANKKAIRNIINRQRMYLDEIQTQYDTETDHSILIDQQSIWQHTIDSGIMALDNYWSSDILRPGSSKDHVKYYRSLYMDHTINLRGGNELMPSEQRYTAHFRQEFNEDSTEIEFSYWVNNKLSEGSILDVAIIKIRKEGSKSTIDFYNASKEKSKTNNGYARIIQWKENNKMHVHYYDEQNQPIANYQGVYSSVYEVDAKGQLKTKRYFDLDGNQIYSNDGEYLIRYKIDIEGDKITERKTNYNKQGKPIAAKGGEHTSIMTLNNNGNVLLNRKLDVNGKSVYEKKIYTVKYQYDELGNLLGETYFDENDSLTENNAGVARYQYMVDKYGNRTMTCTYNSNNVLTANEDGIACTYTKYDAKKNLLYVADFGTGGDVIFDEAGFGKARYAYNEKNQLVKTTNLNGYDFPVTSYYHGSVSVFAYDSLGREISATYFNENGETDTTDYGVAFYQKEYDGQNNLIEKRFYGPDGQLINAYGDIAIYHYGYDQNNQHNYTCYFDEDHQLSCNYDSIYQYQVTYNDLEQLIETRYYDKDDQPFENGGVARKTWKYDKEGNEIELRLYNAEYKLIEDSIAVFVKVYDDRKNVVEERFYDHRLREITGKPSRIINSYNEQNKLISKLFYHQKDPVEDEHGIHQYVYTYKNSNKIGEAYLDKYGNNVALDGIALILTTYDDRDNVQAIRYCNADSALTHTNESIAVIEYEYDLYDRVIEERYKDKTQQPVMRDGKYAAIKYKRLPSGYEKEKIFYDTMDHIINDQDSVAMYRYTYNRNFEIDSIATYTKIEADAIIRQEGNKVQSKGEE